MIDLLKLRHHLHQHPELSGEENNVEISVASFGD